MAMGSLRKDTYLKLAMTRKKISQPPMVRSRSGIMTQMPWLELKLAFD